MRTSVALVALLAVASPAFAQRPNQGDDESAGFVDEGRAALRRGELDDAAKALDQAIALNPRRVERRITLAAGSDASLDLDFLDPDLDTSGRD